jgi:hypothetical protein
MLHAGRDFGGDEMKLILAVMAWLTLSGVAVAEPATVMIFAGQSNEESLGTTPTWFPNTPGGAGTAGVDASALCSETTVALAGASADSGTLTCQAPLTGTIYAGQAIVSGGVAGQSVTAANNGRHFPAATGAGGAGTYVVNNPAVIGTAASPVLMTFSEPDIGGSGTLNPHCQIWVRTAKGAGSWQTYDPRKNSAYGGQQTFGPEGAFCRYWTADNPGQTLYMIKVAISATFLCDRPTAANYSPEYAGAPIPFAAYALLQQEVQAAEAALGSHYEVKMIQWGQGEADSAGERCDAPYRANLLDLIDRFAIFSPVTASFTGSISGTLLTVSTVVSGRMRRFQSVTGAGVLPGAYIVDQVSGQPGGPGVYALQVYQATLAEPITDGVAACDDGYIAGQVFIALPHGAKSCVTGGAFSRGNLLSGAGIQSGTVITAVEPAVDKGAMWYAVNVNQDVGAEPMQAAVAGWGVGSDDARFVTYRVAPPSTGPNGVQAADESLNDQQAAALPVTVVNVDDALKVTGSPVHFHGSWIAELGRRLYRAYLGQCDYHSPTC